MKILFVTTSCPRYVNDHAGSFVFRLAKYLVKDGESITIVAPGDAGVVEEEFIDGVLIKRIPYFWPERCQRLAYGNGIPANLRNSVLAWLQLPFLFFALVRAVFIESEKVDVIHCHWLPTVLVAKLAIVIRRRSTPIIFTNWGSDTRLFPQFIIRWLLGYCNALVSTAAETDSHFVDAGYPDFHSVMAPVDEERFQQNLDESDIRRRLGISQQEKVISFINRLNYFKDPLTFIRACGHLAESGLRFQALIAGDGDLREECEAEVDRLNLRSNVRMLGMRKDPETLLAVSDATVHISPIENTWANIIAEAMFVGVPVVLTSVGHTLETFTDRENVLVVPAESPLKLANALASIVQDEALSKALVDGASRLLESKGKRSDIVVQKLKSVYRSVLTDSANSD